MEMHQIKYFIGVARVLNFTRAAEECNVSQPALTRAIKLLEEELGGVLFRRERNQSHLTDLGQRMLPLLQQCYETAQGAKSLASFIKKGEIATLSLALSRTIDIELILPFLSELIRRMNGLQMKFIRGTTAEIGEILKTGGAELALGGPLQATWDRLDSRVLFIEPLMLVVPEKHRLSECSIVPLDALRQERLLFRTHCEVSDDVLARLQSEGITWANSHEIASDRDLLSLLENGLGVALVPRSTALSKSLRRCSVAGLNVNRSICLHSVAGRQRSAPANIILKQLLAADWEADRR